MVGWVDSLNGAMVWLFMLALAELSMTFLFREGALGKKAYDKVFLVRRVLQLIIYLIVLWTIIGIYGWTGHRFVNGLAEHKCTSDIMLQDTFNYMKKYLDSSQTAGLKIFMYIMLGLLIGLNGIGAFWKHAKCDTTYELPQDHVEPQHEGGNKEIQLKQALIEKKED